MAICLVRHGKPTISIREKINGDRVLDFVGHYNAAKIAENSIPPEAFIKIVQNTETIFTSNLNRAIDSAIILQPVVKPIHKSIFREIDCWRAFSAGIKLSALTWGISASCYGN